MNCLYGVVGPVFWSAVIVNKRSTFEVRVLGRQVAKSPEVDSLHTQLRQKKWGSPREV